MTLPKENCFLTLFQAKGSVWVPLNLVDVDIKNHNSRKNLAEEQFLSLLLQVQNKYQT